jgi:hypothetical protein
MGYGPQTSYGKMSDLSPIPGQPDAGYPVEADTGYATAGISFGAPLERVSIADRTVKTFDGTGTIIGFALKEQRLVSGAGYAALDPVSIARKGRMWVLADAALTPGAAYPGVAQSVVHKVAVIGAQNVAYVDFNLPAEGPALP